MSDNPDVIVIGAGPSGSFTALKLAEVGFDVTVCEEHKEIGTPNHCPGHISIRSLKRLRLYPLPTNIVENKYRGATFYSPRGREFSVNFNSPVTCSVDRVFFDKYLAEKAQRAGAHYLLSSRAEKLMIDHGVVKGLSVMRQDRLEKLSAKIIVDAEGVSSRILRETGLRRLNTRMLVNGIEAEVENVKDARPDTVEVYLGSDYAPGFYAWLMPKREGRAKIGLGAKAGDPREFLRRLMTKHPEASRKLGKAKIIWSTVHPITLGGPISKAYCDGFLAVGDVASQVKSTTGGGVVFGMTCAAIAADVAAEAVRKNDFSSIFLSEYQRRCDDAVGFDSRVMLRMRRTLDAMSDRQLDSLIDVCMRLGLEKTLEGVEDIDFQGRTLLHVLRSPRVLGVLGYLFFAYLFANL